MYENKNYIMDQKEIINSEEFVSEALAALNDVFYKLNDIRVYICSNSIDDDILSRTSNLWLDCDRNIGLLIKWLNGSKSDFEELLNRTNDEILGRIPKIPIDQLKTEEY